MCTYKALIEAGMLSHHQQSLFYQEEGEPASGTAVQQQSRDKGRKMRGQKRQQQ
jgi:hypothetical protein